MIRSKSPIVRPGKQSTIGQLDDMAPVRPIAAPSKLSVEEMAKRVRNANECFADYNLDTSLYGLEVPREKRRENLGILPRAPYGCMTDACAEQNRLAIKSEEQVRNSDLGKKIQCVEDCTKIKNRPYFQNRSYGDVGVLDKRYTQYYSAVCEPLMNTETNDTSISPTQAGFDTNKLIMLVAGGIIVYSLLKK